MAHMLFRIEGCNVGATLYDTGDLSTIRGASRAYLQIPKLWPSLLEPALGKIETVVVGASDGIYRAETEATAEKFTELLGVAIQNAGGSNEANLVPYLSFTFAAVAESTSYKDDIRRLVALCRSRQLQQLTVDVPPLADGATKPCPVDRKRPAATPYAMPDGQQDVSLSVAKRREYGRATRSRFYKDELEPEEAIAVIDSFQDLVTDYRQKKPISAPKGLSPALQNKIAVVYMDGNKFTAIRESVVFQTPQDGADAARSRHKEFSEFVHKARASMLRDLLACLKRRPEMWHKNKQGDPELRFETLLWGGDEALFVLPAWALFDALPALAAALDNPSLWTHGEFFLSHATGIVICNVKTPIAVAKSLAEFIADAAKDVAKKGRSLKSYLNVFSIQVLESVEPPRQDVEEFREGFYGTRSARAFTLIGHSEIQAFLKLMRDLQKEDGGLPRSQLYKLIRSARSDRLLVKANALKADAFLKAEVAKACQRCGCRHLDDLRLEILGYSKEAPLLPLIRIAETWDYVDPLPNNPPPPAS